MLMFNVVLKKRLKQQIKNTLEAHSLHICASLATLHADKPQEQGSTKNNYTKMKLNHHKTRGVDRWPTHTTIKIHCQPCQHILKGWFADCSVSNFALKFCRAFWLAVCWNRFGPLKDCRDFLNFFRLPWSYSSSLR